MYKMKIYDSLTVEQEEKGIVEEIREITNRVKCHLVFDGPNQSVVLYNADCAQQVVCEISFYGDIKSIDNDFFENRKRDLEVLRTCVIRNLGSPNSIAIKAAMKDLYLFKWLVRLFSVGAILGVEEDLKFMLNTINDAALENRLCESIESIHKILNDKKQNQIVECPRLLFEYNS